MLNFGRRIHAQGEIIVERLPAGHYEIIEESTQEGYIPYDKPISFTIDSQGNTYIDSQGESSMNQPVKIENDRLIMMETGGVGNIFAYTAAFLLAVTALLFCQNYIKKQN